MAMSMSLRRGENLRVHPFHPRLALEREEKAGLILPFAFYNFHDPWPCYLKTTSVIS